MEIINIRELFKGNFRELFDLQLYIFFTSVLKLNLIFNNNNNTYYYYTINLINSGKTMKKILFFGK